MRKYSVIILAFLFMMSTVVKAQEYSIVKTGTVEIYRTLANAPLKVSPDNSASNITFLKQGTWVRALGEETDTFLKVITEEKQIGWLMKKLVTKVSADQIQDCQGVEGFSFVCPVNKDSISTGQEVISSQDKKQVFTALKKNTTNADKEETLHVKAKGNSIIKEDSKEKVSRILSQKENTLHSQKGKSEETPSLQVGFDNGFSNTAVESFIPPAVVEPNKTTMVKMSALDINRIHCVDGDITDVIYSDERGVKVKIIGQDAFVKFPVRKVDDSLQYSKAAVDLFAVCNGKVYSIIAQPLKTISSTLTYLKDRASEIEKNINKHKDLPFEKRLVDIIRNVYTNQIEPHYEFVPVNKRVSLYENMDIIYKGYYNIEGEGLNVKLFIIRPVNLSSQRDYIEFKEKDFLRKVLTIAPVAISLDKTKLYSNDKAVLIIVERRNIDVK